jgi:type VI secretion system protein ImpJ
MRNLPVHWSEGMFLRPHHFQAADRYWNELIQASEHLDHQYDYGIRQLEYSREGLLNFQFQVNSCLARMKDGTLVSLGLGQEPDRVELKSSLEGVDKTLSHLGIPLQQAFEAQSKVRVFLGVPKLKLGAPNVAVAANGADHELHRYRENQTTLQDESRGGNDQEVLFRTLNVRLLLSTQDLSGYELLPIADIERAGMNDATPQVSPAYMPPLLAIDAWPPLGRDIVRAIYDMVGAKLQVLADQVLNRGITLASQEPGDLDRVMMLSQLNEAYATLGVLAFAAGVHPFSAYTELCRLVGKLSIFGEERRAPEVPRYDHDDLAKIFRWVKDQIDKLLHAIREQSYQQRFFVRAGLGMQVSLEPIWLNPDWQWYVGAPTGELSDAECRELLSRGQLDWKLGSKNQVEQIFERGMEGLQLLPLDRTPRALPGRGWIYYEVTRQNAAWRDVQSTQTLAMRFRDSLVVNRNDPSEERTLIVNYRGTRIGLQFALFAVPLVT